MGFKLPSFEYPRAKPEDGYWAPVTSTINWCEEDYYATIYSAEIVNTFTNLLFLYLGTKGIRNCLKYEHDSVYMVAFAGCKGFQYISIGETLMISQTCSLALGALLSISRLVRQLLGVGLASLAIFITNAFAILTALILFRSMYVMEVNIRPSFKKKYRSPSQKYELLSSSERLAIAQRDTKILNEMWLMVGIGLSIFLGGFGIWALDIKYCGTVRRWRHQIGLPWGILLEGHGWWHLMTGYGAYCYLVWGVWLRHCLNERQDEYVLKWPSIFFSIPEVVPLSVYPQGDVPSTNGHTNGYFNGYAPSSNGNTSGNTSGNTNGYANGYGNGNSLANGKDREDRKSV
ncbi:Alkaline ceramidase [Lachnellula occidentalis]|uniref:Alkaline ceramidase n=1 Tax=Lachnellula occidentalis TaxID=215460 RepID=A0A8H8UIJ1_9HELO|nr:Alkaline ceramidase [Lachnellula occidentalis]